MATNLMDSYEQQYSLLTAEIVSQTGKINNLSTGEKQSAIRHVEKLLEEAKELLEQMDIEIRDIPVKDRDRHQTRLKSYRSELLKLEKDFKKARTAFSDDAYMRDELLGVEDAHHTEDQRARLLDNTEKLERTGQRIDQGYKTCLETEQIGAQILEDLSLQRSTLQRARDRLRDTNEGLGKSSRVLSSMIRRVIQNRLILILLAFAIIAVVIVGIYLIVRGH